MKFIVDKNGQWKNPGKNTFIPNANGRITMKGVGYPLLGIDDEGNSAVMQPGGEYQFPGNSVYEIPLTEDEAMAYADNGYIVEELENDGLGDPPSFKEFLGEEPGTFTTKNFQDNEGYDLNLVFPTGKRRPTRFGYDDYYEGKTEITKDDPRYKTIRKELKPIIKEEFKEQKLDKKFQREDYYTGNKTYKPSQEFLDRVQYQADQMASGNTDKMGDTDALVDIIRKDLNLNSFDYSSNSGTKKERKTAKRLEHSPEWYAAQALQEKDALGVSMPIKKHGGPHDPPSYEDAMQAYKDSIAAKEAYEKQYALDLEEYEKNSANAESIYNKNLKQYNQKWDRYKDNQAYIKYLSDKYDYLPKSFDDPMLKSEEVSGYNAKGNYRLDKEAVHKSVRNKDGKEFVHMRDHTTRKGRPGSDPDSFLRRDMIFWTNNSDVKRYINRGTPRNIMITDPKLYAPPAEHPEWDKFYRHYDAPKDQPNTVLLYGEPTQKKPTLKDLGAPEYNAPEVLERPSVTDYIEPMPVIKPELIVDTSLPEELVEGEDFNNDYKTKRVVDKIKMPKINKRGKIRRGPFGTKTTRSVRYEPVEEEQIYPEGFVPMLFKEGGPIDLELSSEEALAYAQNGYIVEEMHEGGPPHKHPHDNLTYAQRKQAYDDSLTLHDYSKALLEYRDKVEAFPEVTPEMAAKPWLYDKLLKDRQLGLMRDFMMAANPKVQEAIGGPQYQEAIDRLTELNQEDPGYKANWVNVPGGNDTYIAENFTTYDKPKSPPRLPTMKEAYVNVDKNKYPTFEDFEFAAEYYNETGTNPDPSDFPSAKKAKEAKEYIDNFKVDPFPEIDDINIEGRKVNFKEFNLEPINWLEFKEPQRRKLRDLFPEKEDKVRGIRRFNKKEKGRYKISKRRGKIKKEGGYVEAKLTNEEAEQYRARGYNLEELPKVQNGGDDKTRQRAIRFKENLAAYTEKDKKRLNANARLLSELNRIKASIEFNKPQIKSLEEMLDKPSLLQFDLRPEDVKEAERLQKKKISDEFEQQYAKVKEREEQEKLKQLREIGKGLSNADWEGLGNALLDKASSSLEPLASPFYQSASMLKDFYQNKVKELELSKQEVKDLEDKGYVVEEILPEEASGVLSSAEQRINSGVPISAYSPPEVLPKDDVIINEPTVVDEVSGVSSSAEQRINSGMPIGSYSPNVVEDTELLKSGSKIKDDNTTFENWYLDKVSKNQELEARENNKTFVPIMANHPANAFRNQTDNGGILYDGPITPAEKFGEAVGEYADAAAGLPKKIYEGVSNELADLKDKFDKTSILPSNITEGVETIKKPFDYIDKFGVKDGIKEYLTDLNSKNPIVNNPEQDRLILKNEKLNEDLQALTYKLGDPDVSAEDKLKYQKEFDELVNQKQLNVDKVNQIRAGQVGPFDTWFNATLPILLNENTLLKFTGDMLGKDFSQAGTDIKQIANKVGAVDKLELSQSINPKFETYAEKLERETDHYLEDKRFDDLDVSKKDWYRWRFRASASNKDPFMISLYGTRGERRTNSPNLLGQGALFHFLDQSPLTGYQHRKTRNFIKKLKPNDYIGVLEKSPDAGNVYALKYKQKKDHNVNSKNSFYIRTNKFDNINFSGRIKDDNFPGHNYWTLKSNGKPAVPISIAPDPNLYDYSSGQSVVFIFKYTPKSGKVQQRYIHFAGSPNEIKKEGFKIKNEYGLKDNELILGVADAGSYSAAVRSKSGKVTNRLLNTTNSGYFNPNSFTGAGAVLLDPKLGEQE